MHPLWIAALGLTSALAADVDRFEPSGSAAYAEGTLQGESARLGADGAGFALTGSFAQNPVVRQYGDGMREPAVSAMLPLTMYGGYTWEGRARFEAFVPLYAWVDAPYQDFRGPALGDMRLQANVPVLSAAGIDLSVVPRVGLPTGNRQALVRQGLVGSLLVAASGDVSAFGWAANAGITGAPATDLGGVGLGSTVDLLGGGWWRATEAFRVGAEVDLRMGLVRGEAGRNDTSSGHLFAQSVLPSGLGLMLGGGGGLIAGLGAPEYRMFAAITFAQRHRDRDGDGIVDADDLCPDEPEDFDGWQDADGCPDLDNDDDGIGDFMDQCPNEPEDLDGWQDADGCPDPDNDGDGILDADDLCPDDAGPASTGGCPDADGDGVTDADDLCPHQAGPADAYGCPDTDGDGVPDYRDACPDQPKPPTEEADWSDGCPKLAWLAGNRIDTAERITFTARNTLDPRSSPMVDAVASLLRRHPHVLLVEIQAHTDNTLGEDDSLVQSKRWADVVADTLARQGVQRGRLVAKGAGATIPVDTNRTESGRATNRRVELLILRQEAIPKPVHPAPPIVAAPASPATTPPIPEAAVAAKVAPGMDPAGEPGRLTISITDGGWANVYLNGSRLTRGAPFTDLPIPAGVHEMRIANPGMGIEHNTTLRVRNGQNLHIAVGGAAGALPPTDSGRSNPWATPAPAPRATAPVLQKPAVETPVVREPAVEAPAAPKPPVQKPAAFDGNFPLFAEEREAAEPPPEKTSRPPRASKKKRKNDE